MEEFPQLPGSHLIDTVPEAEGDRPVAFLMINPVLVIIILSITESAHGNTPLAKDEGSKHVHGEETHKRRAEDRQIQGSGEGHPQKRHKRSAEGTSIDGDEEKNMGQWEQCNDEVADQLQSELLSSVGSSTPALVSLGHQTAQGFSKLSVGPGVPTPSQCTHANSSIQTDGSEKTGTDRGRQYTDASKSPSRLESPTAALPLCGSGTTYANTSTQTDDIGERKQVPKRRIISLAQRLLKNRKLQDRYREQKKELSEMNLKTSKVEEDLLHGESD
jgi:hypothetical protein